MASTSFVNVVCTIIGDCDETNTCCSFLAPAVMNEVTLKELFPYEGNFHFRLKVPGASVGFHDYSFVWLDVDDNILGFISASKTSEIVHMQALLISMDESESEPIEDDRSSTYNKYLENIETTIESSRSIRSKLPEFLTRRIASDNQKRRNSREDGSRTLPSSLQSVAEGASSLWKLATEKVKSTASHLQQHLRAAAPLSDASEGNLCALCDSLEVVFDDSNPDHMKVLTDLWLVLFPSQTFQRHSMIWKDAGWQTADPISETKGSGLLSLQSMVYFGNRFPDLNHDRLAKNRANVTTNYPFAIVAVNITLLLADLLSLRNSKYLSVQSAYWSVFEDPTAFFEIFCVCFHHVDSIWTHRRAIRADFGKIIGETKTLVKQALSKGPHTIQEFKFAAADEGMMVHDLYE